MHVISTLFAAGLLVSCGSDDSQTHDAGLDAIRRLAITVDGPTTVQQNTRTVKVIITANGTTRMDLIPVGGLPATVDVPSPIQLTTWAIQVDGLDVSAQIIGRGTTMVPAGTADTTVTLTAI